MLKAETPSITITKDELDDLYESLRNIQQYLMATRPMLSDGRAAYYQAQTNYNIVNSMIQLVCMLRFGKNS